MYIVQCGKDNKYIIIHIELFTYHIHEHALMVSKKSYPIFIVYKTANTSYTCSTTFVVISPFWNFFFVISKDIYQIKTQEFKTAAYI